MTIEIEVLKTLPNDSKINGAVRVARPSVCRSLFGRVDHDESMDFLQRELTAIAEKDKIKWNFDFEEERPLEVVNNYQWTPVKTDESIPRPYALARLPYLYEHTENSIPETESHNKSKVTNIKLKQTLIDSYIKSQKRSATTTITSANSNKKVKKTQN